MAAFQKNVCSRFLLPHKHQFDVARHRNRMPVDNSRKPSMVSARLPLGGRMTRNYRWIVGILLFSASILNYIDRAALPIIAPFLSKDLHLNPAQLGTIFSTFFIGYAPFCFIGGQASDRFGPKRVYGWAMAFWSLFCGATAIVTGFAQLLIFRLLFGVGEGPMGSVTNKTVRNWFPRQEAGFVMGLAPTGGNMIGAAIAGPVVGFMAAAFGWRIPFVVIMLIGFAWFVAWRILVTDDPSQSRHVSAEELRLIRSNVGHDAVADERLPLPLVHYLRSPVVLAIGSAFFASNYILYFFLSWMPSYLTDVHHLNIKTMSALTVVPWTFGLIGSVGGGMMSDAILRRTGDGIFARKVMIVGGLAGAALCLFMGTQIDSTSMAIVLMSLSIALMNMTPTTCWALLQAIVPTKRMGAVGGYVHLLANLSGIVGPAITGFIVQYGGGYNSSFLLAGGVSMAGALAVAVFVRNDRFARAAAEA
jgi:MFS transporter, ACS family, hexuronate transporter